MDEKQDYSLLIAETLTKYFPFEQARLSMYHSNDIYYRIPRLIFRLKEEDINKNKYNEIKACIESFTGNLKWTIYKYEFSKKGNYILSPSIVCEIERNCLDKGQSADERNVIPADEHRYVCEKAIADIPKLAEHIQRYFDVK